MTVPILDPVVQSGAGKTASPLRRYFTRTILLVVLVCILELVIFRKYFTGSAIPPWDFLGSYNTDAFLWWSEGGFFAPVEWVSSVWAGYPSAINLQSSAWYLPVGLVAAFTPFTLHASAALAALHTALGFFGTYRLVRAFGATFPIATMAATAAFFGVAYYSNAEHVDITRAYALMPWVLLVLSTKWSWNRWWGIPLGAIVLWQAVTGMYPGVLVSTVYVGIVWIVVQQLIYRPKLRQFFLPLAISATAAGLLCAPRLLPYFLMQEDAASGLAETSQFSIDMVGTLLFGYGSTELPNDISMRSFFIPAVVLVLAFFARWTDTVTKLATALLVPSLLLGMPFMPWFAAAQSLPGLGLSRFTMSDFKVFMILGVVLFAVSGASRLLRFPPDSRFPFLAVGASAAFGLVMFVIAVNGPFTRTDWFPGLTILLIVWLMVVSRFLLRRAQGIGARRLVAGALVALTAVSGTVWAYTTTAPWLASRIEAETATFGAPVDDLLAKRTDGGGAQTQRPAREPLPENFGIDDLFSVRWNSVYYSGELAVGGYLNLKGSKTQSQLTEALLDGSAGEAFAEFLAAPGLVATAPAMDLLTPEALRACADGSCGVASVEPESFASGKLSYRVVADGPVAAVLNEAYFEGWHASRCSGSVCKDLEVARHDLGVVSMTLPAGEYVLELDYQTPGRDAGWLFFALGCVLIVAALAATLLKYTYRKSLRKHDDE